MRNKYLFALIIAITLFTAIYGFIKAEEDHDIQGGSIKVQTENEADFPEMAKISFQKAMAQALKEVPGKILSVELKEEDNYLIYEIEVVDKNHQIVEVCVDAGNAKILGYEIDKEDIEKDNDGLE